MKNRYLLICPSYPPPLTGGHKVWTYNLVENSGIKFDILTSSLKKGCKEISSFNHKMFREKNIFSGKSEDIAPSLYDLFYSYSYMVFWLIRRNKTVKYDAVIVHGFVFLNGLFFLLGKLLKIPIIGMGNAEEYTLALKGKGWKEFIKRYWLTATHKKASGHIVVCDFCKDILISVGVNGKKIFVVPSSINPNKLEKRSENRKRGHSILSVGRLVERKGFHKLIDAVEQLKDELPDIKVNIVGDGPFRPVIEKQVKDNGLERYVFIRGRLDDCELARLYRECDLFVLAHMMLENGDTEGCPTVFSEASGCGLPVIGGTEAGASTVIIEGKTGYIVNSRNIVELAGKIKMILTNHELAAEMGKAGIQKILHEHTPKVTGKKFGEVIKKIAQGF